MRRKMRITMTTIMNTAEFIRVTDLLKKEKIAKSSGNIFAAMMAMRENRPEAICADGFKMSIQASDEHYCQKTDDGSYASVEIGFPSSSESLLDDYGDDRCTAMCRSLLSMPSSPSTVESCSMSSKPLIQFQHDIRLHAVCSYMKQLSFLLMRTKMIAAIFILQASKIRGEREFVMKTAMNTNINTNINTNTTNSKKVIPGINDVATKCPMAATMWSDKNTFSPSKVAAGSRRKFTFVCPDCGQEFESKIFSVVRSVMNGNTGCPVCAGKRLFPASTIWLPNARKQPPCGATRMLALPAKHLQAATKGRLCMS